MDGLKQVIAEWVLRNGKVPGFADRVKASLPLWNKVGPKGMIVYRAQGGNVTQAVPGSSPNTIILGARPVLATSKTPGAITRYAGESCCIFEIYLAPGTRYIDVNAMVTFRDKDGNMALGIKNAVLEEVRKECPEFGTFPTKDTTLPEMRKAILDRCNGRGKFIGTLDAEYIPAENEIMVYADGVLSDPAPIPKILNKDAYWYEFRPNVRGGGKTIRRRRKTRRGTSRK